MGFLYTARLFCHGLFLPRAKISCTIVNMKENYKAWQISYNDFYQCKSIREKLLFLIGFGLLAPSSLNSQPWKFAVENNEIFVSFNKNKSLPSSDPENRLAYISLGAAIQNILIAADYFGFKPNFEYIMDESVAKITFDGPETREAKENHLIFYITKRRTNRNPYETRMPSVSFFEKSQSAANNIKGAYITFITDEKRREKLGNLALNSLVAAMDEKSFRYELSRYLKSNITSSKVGMPGFTFGIPTIFSFFSSQMIKYVNVNRKRHRHDMLTFGKFTPAFGVITSDKDNEEGWIAAGRLFQNSVLEATRCDLETAAVAAVIQTREAYKELQSIAGLTLRPQFCFRVGYCNKKIAPSPRLNTQDVI